MFIMLEFQDPLLPFNQIDYGSLSPSNAYIMQDDLLEEELHPSHSPVHSASPSWEEQLNQMPEVMHPLPNNGTPNVPNDESSIPYQL